jgi:hypothetical protein
MAGLYVAISPHGFGHTTRTCSILAALQSLMPNLPITIVTTAPQWLIDSYLIKPYHYRPVALDIGVVQADGLQMDKLATLNKLQELIDRQAEIVNPEGGYIKSEGIELVFADMPPLGVSIARSGGVPCWISSNFGWDLIYQEWLTELPEFQPIVDWVQELYSQADLLLRQPFCEEMPHFRHKIDVGLTGGTPKFSPPELRKKLGLDPDRSVVLLSFGGLGLQAIPYHNVQRYPQFQFLTFADTAPQFDNLKVVSGREIRPVDIMPLCHAVITKPGYSTIAEACRLGVNIVCLTRSGFAEGAYLLAGVENYMNHQIISPADFYEGDWQFLDRPFISPKLTDQIDRGGEWTIAERILVQLQSTRT